MMHYDASIDIPSMGLITPPNAIYGRLHETPEREK